MTIDNRKIAKNTLLLYMRMLLLMAVTMYTSRVVLATLGIEDYGIYNLIGGFVTLFSFVSSALVGAMQRYFNVALGHGDHEEYKRIYSMGINIFAIFSVCFLIVGETIGLWFVRTQLNIPVGREGAAFWVYQISLLTVVVNLFRTPDNASIIAYEKMDFYAYISILEAVGKLVIVFLLKKINSDKLILYVMIYILVTFVINIIYKIYCIGTIQDCRYKFIWDIELFKSMISFSGWNMLSGGARVIKSQGDSFLLNHYYTVSANAAFGIAAQVYNAVNMFLTNFQTAFKPQLVQSYASKEIEEHNKLLLRTSKLSYYLLLIIVVPVAFNLEGLLGIWLKEVPKYTREFCIFVLMAYLVDALGAPLAVSVNANGNIRGMQVCNMLIILFSITISYISLRYGAKPYAITIVTFVVHIGFGLTYMYFARRICGVKISVYAKQVILPAVLVLIISMIIPFCITFLRITKWVLPLVCIMEAAWTALICCFWGMNTEEKHFVLKLIEKIKNNLTRKNSQKLMNCSLL